VIEQVAAARSFFPIDDADVFARQVLHSANVLRIARGGHQSLLPDRERHHLLAALRGSGYDGVVSVEHEDRRFEGDPELVKRGFLIARETLRPLIA